jgi:hypothetical protein
VILTGVVLSVVVALLRGGKLDRLGDLGLKGLPLAWLALIMRYSVVYLAGRGFDYGPAVQVAAYLIFCVVLYLNISVPGMKLFAVGSLLNFLVIAANGGAMPVGEWALAITGIETMPVGTHSLLLPDTKLAFLADIIPVWAPYAQIISVGDILIVVGIFLYIQRLMRAPEVAPALVSAGK